MNNESDNFKFRMSDECREKLFGTPPARGYESPITGIINEMAMQISEQRDNAIVASIGEQIGVQVDKDRLIKALNFDSQQYEKGYSVGYTDGYKIGFSRALEKMNLFLLGETVGEDCQPVSNDEEDDKE